MKEADWWTNEHTSAWDRLKATLKRDWERAKTAFAGKSKESDAPTTGPEEFSRAEPALRYGVGSSRRYPAHSEWDEALESKLSGEWILLEPLGPWHEAKEHVRRGWEAGRADLKGKSGKIGWALLWLLGIPLPILIIVYLIRGH